MSNLSFKTIIENSTNTQNIGYYIIHLEKATERLDTIHKLQHDLNTPIITFPAADGYEIVKNGHPTTCQERGSPHTRGAGCIGCTVSHINICKEAIAKGQEYAVIFEDDCVFASTLDSFQNIMNQFASLQLPFDLFTLGYSPVSALPVHDSVFSKINRFNGTYGSLLSQTFMKKLVDLYEKYYNNNTTLSIDTMYSNVIEQYNMNAYGITNPSTYFSHKDGMYSYVIEKIR
jgi:GR25 family glycosyltransferase involved in LPS biosynthesis